MENKKTLSAIRDFIITAEKSIKNAKKLLKDILEDNDLSLNLELDFDTKGLSSYSNDESKVIEGIFTGDEMLGSDFSKYPVPVNYASKSKLVQGDRLKLTVENNGKMTYKQILPIEREYKTGLIIKENGKFQVISEGKVYNLLTASVTHFKCEVGNSISIILPAGKEASFAAIEALIPKK